MASFHGRRDEFSSENTTWELVSLPPGRKLAQCKWVFRTKVASDGSTYKYKASMVAKGFSQVQGVDYHETFALVAKMDSIHLVLEISAPKHWEVHHMDVNSAFLHGDIHEEIYMKQPKGYISDSALVCKLNKSLYGLKQIPREWYSKMDAFLLSQNFQRCKLDPNLYIQQFDGHFIIIVLYVDDLLITGSIVSSISSIKTALHNAFEMSDLGLLKQILGLEIEQNFDGISHLVQIHIIPTIQV